MVKKKFKTVEEALKALYNEDAVLEDVPENFEIILESRT